MPIAIARSPRGHPTRWARNLSRAPVDAIPATDVGSNAKRRLRTIDAGFDRQYRRQPNPNPQPSRDARLRQLLKGRGVFARLPAIGVNVQAVHFQSFDATVAGQSFEVMLNLGEEFAGRIILIALTNIFQSQSSGGNYVNVFLDGVACTEEGVESFGSLYSIVLPSKTNAILTFETDSGHDTTGNLTVQAFNVKGAQLPAVASDFNDSSTIHVTAPLSVTPYGAIFAASGGPAFTNNPRTIWSANVDLDVISEGYVQNVEFDMKSLSGAAWKQVLDTTEITITVTGDGSGSSFTNVGALVLSLAPPHISVEETFFDVGFADIVSSEVSVTLLIEIDSADAPSGNDDVFLNVNIGGVPGRLLIFAFYGQFFAGDDQGQTIVGASFDGTPLIPLSNIITGGYSFGATFYIVDPGFPATSNLLLSWGLDPATFGLPFEFVSIWGIGNADDTTPILDFDSVFSVTSDGVESVTLNTEDRGAVVAMTFGATYDPGTNLQTWTGIDNSTTFGFQTVTDVGSITPTPTSAAYTITSDDDDDIADQIGAEKFLMAVSIKPAPPIEYDIIFSEAITLQSYSFTLRDVANVGASLVTPAAYTYTLTDVATGTTIAVTPYLYTYEFVGVGGVDAMEIIPSQYTLVLTDISPAPGFWFEGGGITDNWVEQATESDGWTEQAPLSGGWTEESA